MRLLTALALCLSLEAQTPAPIHVTAERLSQADMKAVFGPLAKQYGVAKVTVCSTAPDNMTVPLGLIGQQAKTTGVTILPNLVALQVIALAQNSTRKAKIVRGSIAAIELAAIASTWSGLGASIKNTLTGVALAGGQSLPILLNATNAQALVAYSTAALPDPLQFSPAAPCPSGLVLIETKPAGQTDLDFTITVPNSKQ